MTSLHHRGGCCILNRAGWMLALFGMSIIGIVTACADQAPTAALRNARIKIPAGGNFDYVDPMELPESSTVTVGPTTITKDSTTITAVSNAGRHIDVVTICDYCTLAEYTTHVAFSEGASPSDVSSHDVDYEHINHVEFRDWFPVTLPKSCGVSLSASTTHTAREAARVWIGVWFLKDLASPVNAVSTGSYPARTCTAPTAHFSMTDEVGGLQNDGDYDAASANDGETLVVQPGDPVNFDGSSSTAGDTTITRYVWDVDGSDADSGEAATYYFEPGDYDINLNVTDANDMTATATGNVNVVGQDSTQTVSGGGENGDRDCWDVYLIETDDDTGEIINAWYLYSYCCDSNGCEMS